LLSWPLVISVTLGLIVGLLAGQVEAYLHTRRIARFETQLADAIDLMVGALSAGAGAMAAMTAAAGESKQPLRPLLDETLARIRLGDDAQTVFGNLARRVPEETYLLFSSTMAVHWEVGGSLAPTLSTLGRTIRDRIEVARRIRSNIVQSQVSTILVVAITYFIALLMWNHDPNNVRAFLASTIGMWLVAITMLLQAVGIVWMAFMSKMKF
jgi:Flp pilus assembly protein TadB